MSPHSRTPQLPTSPHSPQALAALMALGNTAPVCLLTGMRILRIGDGTSEVVLPFKPELMQAHGRVHGGLYGLLADTAGYFAAASLNPGDGVTVEYKVNLLDAVGDADLIATARATRAGKTITLSEVDLHAGDRLVGKALATFRFFQPKSPG